MKCHRVIGLSGISVDHECRKRECSLWDPETGRCADLLKVQLMNRIVCPACEGIGKDAFENDTGETRDCPRCEGKGVVSVIGESEQ